MFDIKKLAATATVLSCITFSGAHALTEAEQNQIGTLLQNAEDVSDGQTVDSATISALDGHILKGEKACTFSHLLNADEYCNVSAIVFPREGTAIDTIYYTPPAEIGYVNMDDWTEDVRSQIDEIWESYVQGSREQSQRIGFNVEPVKWVLYPTLDKTAKVMTYGILLNFGGDEVINLVTVKFTKSGYVELNVVTDDGMLAHNGATYESVSTYAANTYDPATGTRYADFKDGDKVAAIGAVGVLATVMGVRQNKGFFAAIGATILVFAKKLWFLLLLIPAAIWGFIKRMTGQS